VTVVVVQARFSSSRLPGKVLRPLRGRPMVAHLLDNMAHCREVDGIVLATSDQPSDDPIAAFAASIGVACHRGPLDDVATRVWSAARQSGADALVRVSGDSPLLDPALVDHAVRLFRSSPADLVSNVVTRSFPKGQSVEVMSCDALARAIDQMTTHEEREHVSPYMYAHPEQFVITAFRAEAPRPDLQLSVDDAADFDRCEAILEVLGQPAWKAGWEACARAHSQVGERTAS